MQGVMSGYFRWNINNVNNLNYCLWI